MGIHLQANGNGALAGTDADTAVEELVGAQRIEFADEFADEFAGMVIDNLTALFELIEFLENGNRNDDVVFVEVVNAGAVVQDDVGVDDKDIFRFGMMGCP